MSYDEKRMTCDLLSKRSDYSYSLLPSTKRPESRKTYIFNRTHRIEIVGVSVSLDKMSSETDSELIL